MFSPDPPPAAAASADDSTKDAPVTSDMHAHEHETPQSNTAPSASINADPNGQEDTPGPSTRSLFGPFPETADTSHAGEYSDILPETRPTPEPHTQGRVEPFKEARHQVHQPALNFNPQDRDLSNPGHLNAPDMPDKSALPPLTREKTTPAIGPATDKPTLVTKSSELEGPVLFITLLLSSTGARHPYKLDEKYLRKRNVSVEGNNPINISLYKLKELILRDWRDEWEAKPSSPESIRLISMGKMLNDKARLTDCGFTNGTTPHIIHMTIKPQEIVDDEEAKVKAGGGTRGEDERSPGCRCIVQ